MDDPDRVREFFFRMYERRGQEALQGPTNDLQPIGFLTEGAVLRRAVGKVIVDTDRSHEEGSGFLISPELFITNQHVIRDAQIARIATVEFDYELDYDQRQAEVSVFRLDPDKIAIFSSEIGGLDYAVVALGERVEGSARVAELGCCPLSNVPNRHIVGMSVNIIQHPGGQHKKLSVRNNLLTHRTETTLLYETDTMQGSSGAPVFNDDWDVVALHHYGEPFTEKLDPDGNPFPRQVNEGIRISAIHADLSRRAAALDESRRSLLMKALALAAAAVRPSLPQLEARPQRLPETASTSPLEAAMSSEHGQDVRIFIPVGSGQVAVNIQVGGAAVAVAGRGRTARTAMASMKSSSRTSPYRWPSSSRRARRGSHRSSTVMLAGCSSTRTSASSWTGNGASRS